MAHEYQLLQLTDLSAQLCVGQVSKTKIKTIATEIKKSVSFSLSWCIITEKNLMERAKNRKRRDQNSLNESSRYSSAAD